MLSEYDSGHSTNQCSILSRILFSFRKLPPSFFEENNNGFICYYITVSLVDPDDRDKLLLKTAPLYLKVQIGLARDDLRLPIGTNASKEFGNFCFKKAKVAVYAYITKKGYVTGGSLIYTRFYCSIQINFQINFQIKQKIFR